MVASSSSSNRPKNGRRPRAASTGRKPRPRAANGSIASGRAPGASDGLSGLAEQLANRILKPLGLVILSRERIQETLDEAAERGRLTRTDAKDLGTQLVQRGRQQTEELLADIERLLGRGRQRLDTATRGARLGEPLDRLARGAAVARRKVSGSGAFPISGYDDLTAAQVPDRLAGLSPAELRNVREYERRRANRKSVLAAIDRALG